MSTGSPNILCRWVGYGLEIEGIVVNKLNGSTYCRFFYDSIIWELQPFEVRNQQ